MNLLLSLLISFVVVVEETEPIRKVTVLFNSTIVYDTFVVTWGDGTGSRSESAPKSFGVVHRYVRNGGYVVTLYIIRDKKIIKIFSQKVYVRAVPREAKESP